MAHKRIVSDFYSNATEALAVFQLAVTVVLRTNSES